METKMKKVEKIIKDVAGESVLRVPNKTGSTPQQVYDAYRQKMVNLTWNDTNKNKILGRGGAVELLAKDIRTKRTGTFYKVIYQQIAKNGIQSDTVPKLKDYLKKSKDTSELKKLKIIVVSLILNMCELPSGAKLAVKCPRDKKIPAREYMSNSKVHEIDIAEGVVDIGPYAFAGNINLTKVTLPNSLEKIGAFAFVRDKSLKELTLPERVSFIDGKAFEKCGLEKLTILNPNVEISETAFEGCTNLKVINGNIAENVKENILKQINR